MNVDPIQASSAGVERHTPENKAQPAAAQLRLVSGSTSKLEAPAIPNVAIPSLFPEHEVKVQLDTPQDGIEIYQVLDKQSGNLVLQVPSAEQLRVIHQSQELLREIAARGTVSIPDAIPAIGSRAEGNDNGNKL